MTELADKFFSAFSREANSESVLMYRNAHEVFKYTSSDLEAWQKLYGYVLKHNAFPGDEAFEAVLDRELLETKECASWYYEELVNRHYRKSMIRSAEIANKLLGEKKEKEALAVLEDMVRTTSVNAKTFHVLDFKQSHDLLKTEMRKKNDPDYGIQVGWKTLDEMTGGFRPGDMVSIVGRPGKGKSFVALAAALHAWGEQKKPVLFVSMEMSPDLVIGRLASMYQEIPYDSVLKGHFTKFKEVNKRAEFFDIMQHLSGRDDLPPFYIIGGNFSAEVESIGELTRSLKPAVVVVDGAYLCKTQKHIMKKNERVEFVCDYLKCEVAEKYHIPVIPVWQFAREATKIKKGQTIGTEHIGDSDAIGRNSSVILGLFQENTTETINTRQIQIMKGRSGEQGSFSINWDFRHMDFSEVQPIDDEEVFVS